MKKAIAFDFGKTLVNTAINWELVDQKENELLAQELSKFTKTANKIQGVVKLYREIQKDNREIARNIDIELTELKSLREAMFKKNLKLKDEEIIAILEKITELRLEHFKLLEGVEETLEGLKQKGVLLGIISNNTWASVVPKALNRLGIDKYFEVVVSSSSISYRKPEQNIFFEFRKQMRAKGASEYWMVGDRLFFDIYGGKKSFYKTCYLNLPNNKDESLGLFAKREVEVVKPDFEISNFKALLDIIN